MVIFRNAIILSYVDFNFFIHTYLVMLKSPKLQCWRLRAESSGEGFYDALHVASHANRFIRNTGEKKGCGELGRVKISIVLFSQSHSCSVCLSYYFLKTRRQ